MSNLMAKDFLRFSKRFKNPITIISGLWAISISITQFFINVDDTNFDNHLLNIFLIIITYGLFINAVWNGRFPPADSISEKSSDFSVFMMWSIMILWFLVFIYICIKVMGW